MENRHIFFGAVFVAVFGIGMLNVMSDGRFAHLLTSQVPGHVGTGNASIQEVDKVSLESGETFTRKVKLQNVKRISYRDPTIFENGTDPINFTVNLSPPPGMIEDSLPPNYVYDHREKSLIATLTFDTDEIAEPGEWMFELTAKPSDIRTEEISEKIPVNIK